MPVTRNAASVPPVTDASSGADIQRRRLAIGMSVAELAKRASVDRGRLSALERGDKVRDTTLAAVVRALSDIEHELGMDEPSQVVPVEAAPTPAPHMVRIEVDGVYGAKALVVEGPVDDLPALEAAVDRILRRLAGEATEGTRPQGD